MRTHEEIDKRSLALARAVAEKIDADPSHTGMVLARETCRRWQEQQRQPVIREWMQILDQPWPAVRKALLDESEHGQQLRQNSPFCRTLSPRERWAIYRRFSADASSRS
jgi:hypothetical protein